MDTQRTATVGLVLVGLLVGLAWPVIAPNDFILDAGFLILMWMGLASAWNIIGGYTGYVSFGHVAFFGYGMFVTGLLTHAESALPFFQRNIGVLNGGVGGVMSFLLVLLVGGLSSMVIAAIVAYPVLRLRGHYFAIAMLGIAEASGAIFLNYTPLQGAQGWQIPIIHPPVLETGTFLYLVMFVVGVGTVVLSWLIKRSKIGYGLIAIREGEEAAKMLGVPVTRYKIYGFVLSAFPPGVIGALYAYHVYLVTAHQAFVVTKTIDMIVVTLIGGLGTVTGPIIGAIVFVGLQEIVLSDLLSWHLFVTGLLILGIVLGAPKGLVGIAEEFSDNGRILGVDVVGRIGLRSLTAESNEMEDEQ
ncbi:MAG: branched-chain amino acid ABC transporter permease [Halanaeroarchaeum sp.]